MRRWLIRGVLIPGALVFLAGLWFFTSRWCALAVDQVYTPRLALAEAAPIGWNGTWLQLGTGIFDRLVPNGDHLGFIGFAPDYQDVARFIRRCRRPARLCQGRRALCARPARRHLARQHTGGWHAAGGSGADAGLYGGAGRYGLGRARAQRPRLADAALPSQLHDRLRAVLAAPPLSPLVVGQGVGRAARHFVAPAAGLRCCERLDRRQAHRFDPHRDPAGNRPAPNMGRDRHMTAFDIPTVETARLRLRAFHAADLDAYAETRGVRSCCGRRSCDRS